MISRPEPVSVFKPGLAGGSGDAVKLFVVAFDPGLTTGWCVLRVNLGLLQSAGFAAVAQAHRDPEIFAISSGYFNGPEPYQAELMLALLRGTWQHGEGVFDAGRESDRFIVAYERFALFKFSSDDDLLSPVRVTSAWKQLMWRMDTLPPIVPQLPVDAMKVFPDSTLARLNLYEGPPGKIGEHQRDATRHAGMVARNAISKRWLLEIEKRMWWLQ